MTLLRQLRSFASLALGSATVAGAVWLASRVDGAQAGKVFELVAVAVIAGLSLLIGLTGATMAVRARRLDRRRAAAEHSFRSGQVELGESLQVARSESEAFSLLRRHIERTVPGSEVVVLRRDGATDRVEPATFVADGTLIGSRSEESGQLSCLGIRLGRSYESGGGGDPLLACGICGAGGRRSLCVPLNVAGDVAGAVLVEHGGELSEIERLRIVDSVSQSSTVLTGLHNLALAEARSAADGLTGLPNARAVEASLRRMMAQAGRALSSLSVISLDVDHLRQLNETLGHARGDAALAAVAATIGELLRTSDLAGRIEGGEFVLVLPDTHKDGALAVAEKVRLGIGRASVAGLDWPLSASFGVATFPDDAVGADELLALARAACRAAKSAGRNAVEAAGTWGLKLDLEADRGLDGLES